MKLRIISKSELETRQIAKNVSTLFNISDILLLDGDLGTGKTHFVKGFAEGLGSINNVTSPTFSIANFYITEKKFELLHIDLYRISTNEEFKDLGLYEYFNQNIVIIEWGTKFIDCFDEYFIVTLSYVENEKDFREIIFSYAGSKYDSIIELIKQNLPNFEIC